MQTTLKIFRCGSLPKHRVDMRAAAIAFATFSFFLGNSPSALAVSMPGNIPPGYGYAVAVGDFDCDGKDDVAVGYPAEAVNGRAAAGVVRVFLSHNSSTLVLTQSNLSAVPEQDDYFGFSLAFGDFDGDHCSDLAIGVPGEDVTVNSTTFVDAGAVHVVYGNSTGSVIRKQTYTQDTAGLNQGVESQDNFGFSLAAANIISGGAYSDLAIGVPYEDNGTGMVHVLLGSSTGLTATGSRLEYGTANSFYGFSLAADTLALAVGSPGAMRGNATSGLVNTYDFKAGSAASFGIDSFSSTPAAGDNCGFSVAVHRDGSQLTLAIGAPGRNNGQGVVGVVRGTSHFGLYDITKWNLAKTNSTYLGMSAAIGDPNGDGILDIVFGAPRYDQGSARNVGAVVGLGLSSSNVISVGSTQTTNDVYEDSAYMGRALAFGKSVNQLIVGSPGAHVGGLAGRVGTGDVPALRVVSPYPKSITQTSQWISRAGPAPSYPAGFGAVWAEVITDDSPNPPAIDSTKALQLNELLQILPTLSANHVQVNLAIQQSRLSDANYRNSILSAVAQAQLRMVDIRPWLVLPFDNGYYPTVDNASMFVSAANQLLGYWDGADLPHTTFFIDLEPSFQRAQTINAALGLDLGSMVDLATNHTSRSQFTAAQNTYAQFVTNSLRTKGWLAALSVQGPIVDDYYAIDPDNDLRLLFQIPMDNVTWDIMSFQIYRSFFNDKVGGLTENFVYDYSTNVKQTIAPKFPNAEMAADIGFTDAGPVYPASTWANAGELKKDVEAALLAGITRRNITVYSLFGMIHRTTDGDWFGQNPVDPVPNQSPPAADRSWAVHALYQAADAFGFVFGN